MCELETPRLSRRHFGLLTASALSFSMFPLMARASGTAEALALTCIDYRLVDASVKFYDETLHLEDEYDHVGLAGASLAAVSPKFPSANAAFWDQLQIAKELHHVKKVIALDHRDCGAYKVAFGKHYAGEGKAEMEQHKRVMLHLQAALKRRHPDLGSEFYLMALDGTAEKIL